MPSPPLLLPDIGPETWPFLGFEIGNLHYLGGRVYFGVLQWSNAFMTCLIKFNITITFMIIFQNKYTHIITLFMILFICCMADMLTMSRIRWFVEKVSQYPHLWLFLHSLAHYTFVKFPRTYADNFATLTHETSRKEKRPKNSSQKMNEQKKELEPNQSSKGMFPAWILSSPQSLIHIKRNKVKRSQFV